MYENGIRSWIKHLDFIVLDCLSICVAFLFAYSFHVGKGLWLYDQAYRSYFVVFIVSFLLVVFFIHGYSNIIRRGYLIEAVEIIKVNIGMFALVLTWLVFTKQAEEYSRMFLIYFFIVNVGVMWLVHNVRKQMIRDSFWAREDIKQLLIVTHRKYVDRCVAGLEEKKYLPFKIAGIVLMDENAEGEEIEGIPVVCNGDKLFEYVTRHVVDQVFLQLAYEDEKVKELSDAFLDMGVVVHISLNPCMNTLPNKQLQKLGGWSVCTTSIRTASHSDLFLKRAMDICGGIVGLVITGFLFLFVAPAIYIKSPGPIFFSQERVGKNGRTFKIYKFRSMYMDAEERKKELMEQNQMNTGLMFKMDDDPRIIKGIGHFIRKTSIDEFPQFWNVLKGDMSLVGTRPPTLDEFKQYEAHHKVRLSFKPGLTGMWQTSGRSKITDFEEIVRLDEEYICNWNILLDIKLILKTIVVVLKREGSV